MALPSNTGVILQHLFPQLVANKDYSVGVVNDVVYLNWSSVEQQPTEQQIIDAELPAIKSYQKEVIRRQANEIITAKWPIWKQNNAQSGIYPAAVLLECNNDIAAVIEASNVAEDSIDSATTVTQAESVTATWPII